MKKMNAPMMETVRFDAEDVIATSGLTLLDRPAGKPAGVNNAIYIAGVEGDKIYFYGWVNGINSNEVTVKVLKGSSTEGDHFSWDIDSGSAGIQAGQWYTGNPTTWHLYTPTN